MRIKIMSIIFFGLADLFWFVASSFFLAGKKNIGMIVYMALALVFSILSVIMYVKDKKEKGAELKIAFLIIRYIWTFTMFVCAAYGVGAVIRSFSPEGAEIVKRTEKEFGWYGWTYVGFICLAVIPLALFISSVIKLYKTKKHLPEQK